MPGLRVLALAAVVLGAVLLIASFALPTCRNYAGTARDSGYPCKVSRSSGATDFVFSRSTTISVPLSTGVGIGLLILGGLGLVASRRL